MSGRANNAAEAVGFVPYPIFSDGNPACMVLSDAIHVMLLTRARWKTFTAIAIPDAMTGAQMMLAIGNPRSTDGRTFAQQLIGLDHPPQPRLVPAVAAVAVGVKAADEFRVSAA